MAKKKKKKKKDYGKINPHNKKTVTIIVPDEFINKGYSPEALHGIGRLVYNATSNYMVDDVAIVAASDAPDKDIKVAGWQKAGADP
ncbi:MAG TPA: hypothetical protein VGP76_15725 [Planctomycetaceae bacterium]|jgi:hypothetical protein|nr:hypothetical protein [Planctomycetaceae bacterium]